MPAKPTVCPQAEQASVRKFIRPYCLPVGPGSGAVARGKIDKMSGEVVDSNPYSRLMALQRMGIVKDYERIRSQTVSRKGRGALRILEVSSRDGSMAMLFAV